MATENNNVTATNQESTQEAAPASPEADSTAAETKTDEGAVAPASSEQTESQPSSSESEPKNENNPDTEVIENLKGENYALKAGVKAECAADVLALAKSRVTDKVPLEKAIDLVVEAYPQFKGTPVPGITTSATTSNDAVNEADDAFVNRIMGIK